MPLFGSQIKKWRGSRPLTASTLAGKHGLVGLNDGHRANPGPELAAVFSEPIGSSSKVLVHGGIYGYQLNGIVMLQCINEYSIAVGGVGLKWDSSTLHSCHQEARCRDWRLGNAIWLALSDSTISQTLGSSRNPAGAVFSPELRCTLVGSIPQRDETRFP